MMYLAVSLLFGIGLAVNPCADPSKFTSDVVIPDQNQTCGAVTAQVKDFQASAETCEAVITIQDANMPRMTAMGFAATTCCGGTPSVCADYVMNPCSDREKFDGSIKIGEDSTCSTLSFMVSPFEASAETCSAHITVEHSTLPRSQMIHYMAPCCQGTATVCSAFAFNPCSNPDMFDGSAQLSEDATCTATASAVASFDASAETCSAQITLGDNTMTREQLITWMAPKCCQGTAPVCPVLDTNEAASMTCGDIKMKYKSQGCCGNPAKAFSLGRRLEVVSGSSMDASNLLDMLDTALKVATATGGQAKARDLAEKIERMVTDTMAA